MRIYKEELGINVLINGRNMLNEDACKSISQANRNFLSSITFKPERKHTRKLQIIHGLEDWELIVLSLLMMPCWDVREIGKSYV